MQVQAFRCYALCQRASPKDRSSQVPRIDRQQRWNHYTTWSMHQPKLEICVIIPAESSATLRVAQATGPSLTGDQIWSQVKALGQEVLLPMDAACDFHGRQTRCLIYRGQTDMTAKYALLGYAVYVRTLTSELSMLENSIHQVCDGQKCPVWTRSSYKETIQKIPHIEIMCPEDSCSAETGDRPDDDYLHALYHQLTYAGKTMIQLWKILMGFLRHLDKKYGYGCILYWYGDGVVNQNPAFRESEDWVKDDEAPRKKRRIRVLLPYWSDHDTDAGSDSDDKDYPHIGFVEDTDAGSGLRR